MDPTKSQNSIREHRYITCSTLFPATHQEAGDRVWFATKPYQRDSLAIKLYMM